MKVLTRATKFSIKILIFTVKTKYLPILVAMKIKGNRLSSLRRSLATSTLGRAFKVLPENDRKKLVLTSIIQIFLGLLDLLGVLAVGLIGALSVSGLQSGTTGIWVNQALTFLRLSNLTFQHQALILGIGAVTLFVVRTILSIMLTRRILFFLSRRGATISANLISRLLSQSKLVVESSTTQQNLYSVTTGVTMITLQVLATATVLLADLALLIMMGLVLFLADPFSATGTFLVFFIIVFFLYQFMHVRAGELGKNSSEFSIRSNEKIIEALSSFRESVVRNRRDFYAREIAKLRYKLADTSAEVSFLPYVSKYVIEASVIVGALLIGIFQFFLQDTEQAFATLAIFIAAGTRIAPAVLRVQQGLITIKNGLGQATPTLDLIDLLGSAPMIENLDDNVYLVHDGFVPAIELKNISFSYQNNANPAIEDFTLNILPGTSVAFVGPSGAGKTTVIDMLLGVLTPDSGTVKISGLTPLQAVTKWSGAVAYVPQDVAIAAGTFRENVALGFPLVSATDDLVMSALKMAHLDKFIESLPQGMDTQVGERGAKISGGQRQRLGIARAMFTRPNLLVLDEATSSLDAETEESISQAISGLHGSTTVVMIAHRLSTVRNADIVVYMDSGKIIAKGKFEDVRKVVPEFDHQAKLMGL
jgi:ABC-type multidrug transport system fused ATPase/permease subunit